eukprot:Em0013g841a
MVINKREVPITELVAVAEEAIFGSHASSWPLTKILDIGGTERVPHYSTSRGGEALPEVPPIPCHVHCGEVVNGRCGCGQGKTEAYFFPPLDIPPYNLKLGPVKTRLGLQSHITREEVLKALEQFGCYDDLYSLLNVYEIHPWETWHIEEKLPQDDYNMLAWQLGQPLNQADLHTIKDVHQLKGLPNEGALLQGAINWEMNLAGDFRERWWHSCIAWSGVGTVNGQDLNCTVELMKEFLVVPNHSLEICNTAESASLQGHPCGMGFIDINLDFGSLVLIAWREGKLEVELTASLSNNLFYGRGSLVLAMGAMWVVVAAARGAAGEVVVGALVSILLMPVVGLVVVAAGAPASAGGGGGSYAAASAGGGGGAVLLLLLVVGGAALLLLLIVGKSLSLCQK